MEPEKERPTAKDAEQTVAAVDSRNAAAEFLKQEIAKEQARARTAEKTAADLRALIGEYKEASDEQAPELVKKNIRARVPVALDVLDAILADPDVSPAVRAGVAKWVVDRGIAPDSLGGVDPTTKELQRLVEGLRPDAA